MGLGVELKKRVKLGAELAELKSTIQKSTEMEAVGSDESVSLPQVQVQPYQVKLQSPPCIPCMTNSNQLSRISSKLGTITKQDISSRSAQIEFDNLCSQQELSPTTLVQWNVSKRNSPRLNLVTSSQKSKLVLKKTAVTAMAAIGQTVSLQSCFNESFNKDDFMKGFIDRAQDIRQETCKKKVRYIDLCNSV